MGHGAKPDESLGPAYTASIWGWLPASVVDWALELGRPDIASVLRSPDGFKGPIRTVANLRDTFAFKPYDPNSRLALVPGPPTRDDFTGVFTTPFICRVRRSGGFTYGLIESVSGKKVCAEYDGPNAAPFITNHETFEALYHYKAMLRNGLRTDASI